MFLWKCQSFWDRKCLDLRGTPTANLLIHAECSNHLSNQGQTFAVPYLWKLAVVLLIFFKEKLAFWNVNYKRATAFIFDTRTYVLVEVSKFLRQKMSRPEWNSTPNLRIHAECSNHHCKLYSVYTTNIVSSWFVIASCWHIKYWWFNNRSSVLEITTNSKHVRQGFQT